MDHLTPDNTIKTSWVMWDIPPTAVSLPRAVKDLGKTGASFKGQAAYEPPHSKGPGPKTYVLTLYALSAPASPAGPDKSVTREVLLAALKGKVLASASLPVTYSRDGQNSPSKAHQP